MGRVPLMLETSPVGLDSGSYRLLAKPVNSFANARHDLASE